MGWEEDLANLLGEAGGNVASTGAGQAGLGALGALGASWPVEQFGRVMGVPDALIRGSVGEAASILGGRGAIDWTRAQGDVGSKIHDIQQAGALERLHLGALKTPLEVAANIAIDPSNWLGSGLAVKGIRAAEVGARAAALAERPILAGGLRAAGKGLEASKFVWNDSPEWALGKALETPPGRVVSQRVGALKQKAPFQLHPEFEHQRAFAAAANADAAERSAAGGPLPATVAPMTRESGPPLVPHPHPEGSAPSRLYQGFLDAWEQSWIGKPGSRKPGIFGAIAGTRDHGYASVPPKFSEEHFDDMARSGAALMQIVNDDKALFGGVRRAAVNAPEWRNAMIGQHGEEIIPALPYVWERMKELNPDMSLPSSRFALPHAYPFESVSGKRLASAQEIFAKGDYAPEAKAAALAQIRDFPIGSPEAVEAAAAQGAAFLSLFRKGGDKALFREGGQFFPTEVTKPRGSIQRAVTPTGFAQDVWGGAEAPGAIPHDLTGEAAQDFIGQPEPFGSNRQAWESYMQDLYGQMAPEELNTLADMSIDVLYNEYVNAANDYALGAANFARGTRPTAKAMRGDTYAKAGTRAVDYVDERGNLVTAESQRAARPDLLVDNPRIRKYGAGGSISDHSAYTAQLRDLLGLRRNPNRDDINKILGTPKRRKAKIEVPELRAAIEAKGGTPLQRNAKGGLLPNLEEMFDIYEGGKDLPLVGQRPSPASDWYGRGAREMAMIVGWGNYKQARMFLHLMALTSSSTSVERNAKNALRALAEFEFGHDDLLKDKYGITGAQLTEMVDSQILGKGISQRDQIQGLFNVAKDKRAMPPLGLPGAKEFNYAGSFMHTFWKRQLDDIAAQLPEPVAKGVRDTWNRAVSLFTVDRHQSRVENGPTAVSAIQMHIARERGVLAARAAGVSGEELQAAAWYWSRDRQGFLRAYYPNSDVAHALRKVVQQMYDSGGEPNAESWNDLVNRVMVEGKFEPESEDLYRAVYDLAREDIFYRTMASSFKEKGVASELGKRGFPTSIGELSKQMHGIIARGAHGLYPEEWPNPLGQAMELGDKLETAVAGPPTGPTIFSFQSGTWEPVQGGGLAVPIMDAGTVSPGQTQSARKLFERLISKDIVAQVFDPTTGDRSAQLGIGLVPEGDRYRLGLYALTADPTAAEAGAARAGAKHIVDTASQTMTPTAVTGPRQASLPTLLEEMFGPAPDLPRPSRDEAMRRGITMGEMDTRNPTSLLQRKLIQPLMDAYEALSTEEGLPNMEARGLGDLDVPVWEGDDGGLTRRGYNPRISSNDNAALLRTTNRGVTHREIIAKGAKEGGEAQRLLQAGGVAYKPYAKLEDRIKAAKGNPDLERLIRKWHRLGVDPLYAQHPHDIGLALLEREMRKDAGLKTGKTTIPALLASAWGEQVLASPKYLTGNITGNWIMAALGGHYITLNPGQYLAAFKMLRQGTEGIARAEAMESLKGTQLFRKWGLDGLPQEVMRGNYREVSSNAGRYSPSATGELVGRVTKSDRLGRIVGTPFELVRDAAAGADTVARSSVMGDILDRRMMEMMPAWEAEVRKAGAAIPGFEFSVADSINTPAGGMHTDALFESLTEAGLADGAAERLVRDFANVRGKALVDAREGMQKILFSFEKTNLDMWASKVVPFHYWLSRASRFYFEEAIRHPYLAANYMRAQDGIEQAQQDPGLSARQKGFIHLFGTPLGFSLLMSPDALFGVVKVFNMEDSYETDGETSVGGVITWMKNHGLGLYPWIDGTLNMMGMYGNTFEPDLLGLRHKALVGAAINFVRANTGFEPAGAPYADAMGQLRYATSSFVDSFTPDWLAQTVTPRAGGSSQEAALDTIIENAILSNSPGLTNQQLLDIMNDPESPEYQAAFRQAADAGIVQQLLNFTAPVSFRMRHDGRDVRLAQMSSITEAADAAGVPAYEFAPTPDDLAFRAKYKALTGREWRPGDYDDAKLKNDLARAPTQNKQFILDQHTYNTLGTPKQRQVMKTYEGLLYGTDPRTAGIVDPTARREIANRWADTHGRASRHVTEVYAEKDTFRSTHPEFAEFKDWSGRVRDLAAQYGGSLAEYRRRVSAASPNAARYFAEQEANIRIHYPQAEWPARMDEITTSAAAFQSITGRGTANRLSPGGAASRNEQGPFPGAPQFDPTLPLMEPPAPVQTDWRSQAQMIMG